MRLVGPAYAGMASWQVGGGFARDGFIAMYVDYAGAGLRKC